jgi:hypothetical protein
MAASLAGYNDRLLAAKALALGEAIVTKLERRIGRDKALAYASAVTRRVGHLVTERRKQPSTAKKPPTRRTKRQPRGGT